LKDGGNDIVRGDYCDDEDGGQALEETHAFSYEGSCALTREQM